MAGAHAALVGLSRPVGPHTQLPADGTPAKPASMGGVVSALILNTVPFPDSSLVDGHQPYLRMFPGNFFAFSGRLTSHLRNRKRRKKI